MLSSDPPLSKSAAVLRPVSMVEGAAAAAAAAAAGEEAGGSTAAPRCFPCEAASPAVIMPDRSSSLRPSRESLRQWGYHLCPSPL